MVNAGSEDSSAVENGEWEDPNGRTPMGGPQVRCSTYVGGLTAACTSSPRWSRVLLWPPRVPACVWYTDTHVHTLSGVSALPPPRGSWELNLGHICYDKSPYPMCPLDGPRETLKYFI